MARKTKKALETLGFTKTNYILMALGLGMIIVGYILLAVGDITGAPILLVLGYCAVLPIAILFGRKTKPEEDSSGSIESGSSADN